MARGGRRRRRARPPAAVVGGCGAGRESGVGGDRRRWRSRHPGSSVTAGAVVGGLPAAHWSRGLAERELRQGATLLLAGGIDRGMGRGKVGKGKRETNQETQSAATGFFFFSLSSQVSRRAIPCFFFLCCSLAAFSFLRISLSSLPTASCSAPSAPPCAARVLAQLRAPLLRPDAASRPVSLLERSNLVALDEHRAAMGFSVLSLFCFCLQEANVLPPILLQDLGSRLPLGQRGSKGKANKGGEREKSFSFISATALFFLSLTQTPSLYLDLDLTAPGGKKLKQTFPQTPTARRR